MKERPLSHVPGWVQLLLAVGFCAHLSLRLHAPPPRPHAEPLAAPPPSAVLRAGSLGDPIGLAQALNLYLQAQDTQPGVSLSFLDLDYGNVRAWLRGSLDLDPRSHYPLLMATQVYAQAPDPARQRIMLEFAHDAFLEDPAGRWRALAHAAIVAKHRLGDLPLALRYARALAQHANLPGVPAWARQMDFVLLEDMGEYEAARIVLGGLLASGSVTDPHETRFLIERLNALENKAGGNSSHPTKD